MYPLPEMHGDPSPETGGEIGPSERRQCLRVDQRAVERVVRRLRTDPRQNGRKLGGMERSLMIGFGVGLPFAAGQSSGSCGPGTGKETVKVAVCQVRCVDGDVEGNIQRVTKAVEEAAAKGAEIAAFPEAVFIGWVNTAAHKLAEPIPGKFSETVCHVARKHGVVISIGLTERVEGGIYDSMILVDRKGTILLKHRKINTLKELLTPPYLQGKKEELSAVDTPLGRIGIMICADSFVDEHHEIMVSRKPQLLLIPYGWAADKNEWPGHGKNLERTVSRVAKNVGAATVGANLLGEITTGPWKGKTYEGHSVVADSSGAILAVGKDNEQEVLTVRVPLPPGGRR